MQRRLTCERARDRVRQYRSGGHNLLGQEVVITGERRGQQRAATLRPTSRPLVGTRPAGSGVSAKYPSQKRSGRFQRPRPCRRVTMGAVYTSYHTHPFTLHLQVQPGTVRPAGHDRGSCAAARAAGAGAVADAAAGLPTAAVVLATPDSLPTSSLAPPATRAAAPDAPVVPTPAQEGGPGGCAAAPPPPLPATAPNAAEGSSNVVLSAGEGVWSSLAWQDVKCTGHGAE
jgi:hypothetical protein